MTLKAQHRTSQEIRDEFHRVWRTMSQLSSRECGTVAHINGETIAAQLVKAWERRGWIERVRQRADGCTVWRRAGEMAHRRQQLADERDRNARESFERIVGGKRRFLVSRVKANPAIVRIDGKDVASQVFSAWTRRGWLTLAELRDRSVGGSIYQVTYGMDF